MTNTQKDPLSGGSEDCCSLNSDIHYTVLEMFERIALALERSNVLAREANERLESIGNAVVGVSNRLEDLGRYL